MSDSLEKKILLDLIPNKSGSLLAIIPKETFEIVQSNENSSPLDFILVDDSKIGELKKFSGDIDNGKCKVVLISDTTEYRSVFGLGVRLILSQSQIENEFNKKLITRFFTSDLNLFVENSLNEKDLIKNLKLSSALSFGYYADIVCVDAFEKGLSPISIRSFFVSIATYFAYLHKSKMAIYPFEVNYGFFKDNFFIEINASVQNFYLDYLLEAMLDESKDDLDNLFKHALIFPSSVEIVFNPRSKKLNVVAGWNAENNYKRKFISLTEIKTFAQSKKALQEIKYKVDIVTTAPVEKQLELETKEIPGKSISKLELREGNLLSNPVLLKRLISYCSNKLERENRIDKVSEFKIAEVDTLLNDYPDRNVIAGLDELDKETILKGLQNAEFNKVVQQSLDVTEEDIIKVEGGKEKLVEDVINRIGGVTDQKLEEIIKIAGGTIEKEEVTKIKGGPEDLTEETTVVKGSGPEDLTEETTLIKGNGDQNVKEEITRIKGSKEDTGKAPITIIKGSGEGQDNNKGAFNVKVSNWAQKKDEIISEIRKKFSDMLRLNMPLDRIENALTNVVMTKMEMSESGAKIIVAGLMEEAKASIVGSKATDAIKKNSLDPVQLEKELKRVTKKSETELKVRDEQIVRMKTLMEKLNTEIARLREKSLQNSSTPEAKVGQINVGKNEHLQNAELAKLQNESLDKDLKLQKLKEHYEKSDKRKNEIIEELKARIEYLSAVEAKAKIGATSAGPSINGQEGDKTAVPEAFLESEIENLKQKVEAKDIQFEKYKKIVEENEKNKNRTIEELKSKIEILNKRNDLPTIEKNEKLTEVMANTSSITDINKATEVINIMKSEINKFTKELENAKINFEKLKQLNDLNTKNKNEKIAELEQKIRDFVNKDKKDQIEGRREDQKKEEQARKEAEQLKRQQNAELQDIKELERLAAKSKELEEQNKELEKRVSSYQQQVSKLQSELMSADTGDEAGLKQEINEQKTQIDQMKKDLLVSESKAKQFELELKRAEHKAQGLEAKVKVLETQKQAPGAKGQGKVNETQDGKSQVKVKQLEAVNTKLTETNKKMLDELTAKKSEVIKLKQENTHLKNQVAEFEKKSSSAKKAG